MDFNLSEERRMLKDTAERFIREQYPIQTRHEFAASDIGFSREMWREFADLGLIGALMPPAVDGYGGTGEDILLVFEALGRGLVVEPFGKFDHQCQRFLTDSQPLDESSKIFF